MEPEKIIKILILIGLFCILILIRVMPLDNCDSCKFNISGQEIKGADKFMPIYSDKCFKQQELDLSSFNIVNLPNASVNNA